MKLNEYGSVLYYQQKFALDWSISVAVARRHDFKDDPNITDVHCEVQHNLPKHMREVCISYRDGEVTSSWLIVI